MAIRTSICHRKCDGVRSGSGWFLNLNEDSFGIRSTETGSRACAATLEILVDPTIDHSYRKDLMQSLQPLFNLRLQYEAGIRQLSGSSVEMDALLRVTLDVLDDFLQCAVLVNESPGRPGQRVLCFSRVQSGRSSVRGVTQYVPMVQLYI